MQKVKDMSWNNTASVRRTALCFVLAFFSFPPFLAAQEPTSVTKAELVKRLENRVEKLRSFAVSYNSDQIFPEGCFNGDVAMVHGDDEALGGSGGGEIPEGNWPSETTIRDVDVEWILRLDDELSVIEVGRSVFNDWSLQFAPLRRRSFFSGKGDPAIVSFEPRSGNPGGDPIAIPENAPEYFEGWPPNMDANHASVIGRGLFQSIGLAWHSGGNPLMQKKISADAISNLQPISETRHSFVVTDVRYSHDANSGRVLAGIGQGGNGRLGRGGWREALLPTGPIVQQHAACECRGRISGLTIRNAVARFAVRGFFF